MRKAWKTSARPGPPAGVPGHQFQAPPFGGWSRLRGLLRTGFGSPPPPPDPRAPDCFFQLGNLTFAEADYEQALELSPQDEGAHLRMGLLQEKMGFCEQRSK